MWNGERWEYLTLFLWASAEDEKEFLSQRWPDRRFKKYAPQALVPELNRLGENGWELVHMEPVYVGKNDYVLSDAGSSPGGFWSNWYFCAFKRRIPT